MTAEIIIMNKNALAMAADSVVTITNGNDEKTYQTANKLFPISYEHEIGIMTYGSAEFMGVPWETLIKLYRERIEKIKFETLKECIDNFIHFLENSGLFSVNLQNEMTFDDLTYFHMSIRNKIQNILKMENEKANKKTKEREAINVSEIAFFTFQKMIEEMKSMKQIQSETDFLMTNKIEIETMMEKIYEETYESNQHLLNELNELYFKKLWNNSSGIVISGFGERDIFPSTYLMEIDKITSGRLIYCLEKYEVDNNNAFVIPFAQREMVDLFMRGISPILLYKIEEIIKNIDEDLAVFVLEEFIKYLEINHSKPIMEAIKILPKPELAIVAEMLISLTSFKRKISTELETVGGPIDVAVISKGDGFVWIKRKQYFDQELNIPFISKYFKNK
ncbi:hypothetical protein MsAg5_17860 [Methanosarcinaceae archaeon Ag5]|uniref:Uncharacterized protein n=1 Tax=Methanolapillus africanus TaxID=3028297 RepID=A0AAE4MKG5_9EURY|nr:hypothetical protein [Methanosarcinaceae archaeon Ag5]